MNKQHIMNKVAEYLEFEFSGYTPDILVSANAIEYKWSDDACGEEPCPNYLCFNGNTVTVGYNDQSTDRYKFNTDTELDEIIFAICNQIFWGYGEGVDLDKFKI